MDNPFEELMIVPKSQLKYRNLWAVGWLLAVVGVSFGGGAMVAMGSMVKDLDRASDRVSEIQQEQTEVNAAFLKNWENQQESIDLIISASKFFEQRNEITAFNRDNSPKEIKRK